MNEKRANLKYMDIEIAYAYAMQGSKLPKDLWDWTNEESKEFSFRIGHYVRDRHISKYGFIFISEGLLTYITAISENKPIVSVGSGTGFLEHMLEVRGHNVLAIDNDSRSGWEYIWKRDVIMDIEEFRFQGEVVLMSWPDYEGNWPLKVLQNMNSGQKLIYLGESYGGACASDEFFEYLEEQFEVESEFVIYSIWGIHDECVTYRKR